MIWAFALKNWRIIGLVAGLGVLGWWHQHAVTKAYRQGATDGEASTLQKAAMKVEMDTIEERKALADRKTDLDAQQASIAGERAALNTARAGITAALSASLNQIAVQGVDIRNEVQAVPDYAINSRFREALAHARTSERERSADH
jgi:hypothetical protein